jgi:hypothetical protein
MFWPFKKRRYVKTFNTNVSVHSLADLLEAEKSIKMYYRCMFNNKVSLSVDQNGEILLTVYGCTENRERHTQQLIVSGDIDVILSRVLKPTLKV